MSKGWGVECWTSLDGRVRFCARGRTIYRYDADLISVRPSLANLSAEKRWGAEMKSVSIRKLENSTTLCDIVDDDVLAVSLPVRVRKKS